MAALAVLGVSRAMVLASSVRKLIDIVVGFLFLKEAKVSAAELSPGMPLDYLGCVQVAQALSRHRIALNVPNPEPS